MVDEDQIDCGYTIKWKGNAKEKYSFVLKTKNYQSKEILQEKRSSQNVLSKVPKLFKMLSYQHFKNGFRILKKKVFPVLLIVLFMVLVIGQNTMNGLMPLK